MEPSLSSSIQVKIRWARDLYARLREKLLHTPEIISCVKDLEYAIAGSRQAMSASGLSDICRKCEIEGGGSCCGAGLENKYSTRLLFINLLLGTGLPATRYDKSSCFFLGEKGCLLKARHAICVNYVCSKITDQLGPNLLAPLREKEGIELEVLFGLNEKLKEFLK